MDHRRETSPGRRRRGAAFAGAGRRLSAPRRHMAEPAWTRAMTAMLAAGLVLVLFAHLLDAPAERFVLADRSGLVKAMAYVTDVGLSQWYLVPAGLLFLAVAMLDWEARDRLGRSRLAYLFGQAGYAFAAVAVSGLIGTVVKLLVGRARPKFFLTQGTLHFQPFTPGYDFSSFPSGHSTTVGAVAMVLMLWFPRWRVPICVLAVLAAATRVAARAHYPSDVVAGLLLGMLYALFLARGLAARGAVFRLPAAGALLPLPRFRLLPAARSSTLGGKNGRRSDSL